MFLVIPTSILLYNDNYVINNSELDDEKSSNIIDKSTDISIISI